MVVALHDLDEVRWADQPVERGAEWLAAVAALNLAHQEIRGFHRLEEFTPEPKVAVCCVFAPPALQVLLAGFVDQGNAWKLRQHFVEQVDNGGMWAWLDFGVIANRDDRLDRLRLTPGVDEFRRN